MGLTEVAEEGCGRVLPDCDQLDDKHDPPGRRPAVYLYEYAPTYGPFAGVPGTCRILCVGCCARIRAASQQPDANHDLTPLATRITVLVDPNTLERAI